MIAAPSSSASRPHAAGFVRRMILAVILALACVVLVVPAAFAGQASSGELFFYPCTSCHPVGEIPGTEIANRPLPGGFKGHEIVLIGHDALGVGRKACLVCHDDPMRNPGKLKLADGSLVDIKGDVSRVCYRCHSTKYKEWKAGTHGRHQGKCTASGCHDPHTPGFIFAKQLMPFNGSGFQFKVLSQREPFMPYASPAPAPAVVIPSWFFAVALVGVVVAGGLVGKLILGRTKR